MKVSFLRRLGISPSPPFPETVSDHGLPLFLHHTTPSAALPLRVSSFSSSAAHHSTPSMTTKSKCSSPICCNDEEDVTLLSPSLLWPSMAEAKLSPVQIAFDRYLDLGVDR